MNNGKRNIELNHSEKWSIEEHYNTAYASSPKVYGIFEIERVAVPPTKSKADYENDIWTDQCCLWNWKIMLVNEDEAQSVDYGCYGC